MGFKIARKAFTFLVGDSKEPGAGLYPSLEARCCLGATIAQFLYRFYHDSAATVFFRFLWKLYWSAKLKIRKHFFSPQHPTYVLISGFKMFFPQFDKDGDKITLKLEPFFLKKFSLRLPLTSL